MFRKIVLLLIFITCTLLEAALPDITARDVKYRIEDILKSHVSYSKLTPELIRRVLGNFLEELDPTKTYFIESELQSWLSPSDASVEEILLDFKRSKYKVFEQIHAQLLNAISRRNDLEIKLENAELPQNVELDQFKDSPWPTNSEELYTRIMNIKALQVETAEKFDAETKDLFLQMVKKRRLLREGEIIGTSEEEKTKWILTHILKATCSSLDSHTNYFTPSEASQFMIHVQQRLFGIGAQLKDTLNGFTIMRIIEGGPADLSGKIKLNDRIVAVDHKPIVGMDILEAVELIRGEKGTFVQLTVLREIQENEKKQTEKFDIEIAREEVVLEESRLECSTEPFADGVIAYLKLHSFYQDPNTSCTKDIRKALENVKKKHNLKGVVFDLRSNAGGIMEQAVSVTGLFITKGIVVSLKDNQGKLHHSRIEDNRIAWDGPLAVLLSRASASAAEIVAQSLQDYGRAVLVGDDHSFGKGTFQTLSLDASSSGKVNSKGETKVTRGTYYTVSGKSPQLKGVESDIIVPGILSQIDIGESYAKFPLKNDNIKDHYQDDLSDLNMWKKHQLGSHYKNTLQTKLVKYTKYFPLLKKNSGKRIEKNKNYQNFLEQIQKKRFDSESVELFGQSDLQLQECFNIIKDLVFLLETEDPMQ